MSKNFKNRAGIRDKIKRYCKQNNTCGQEKEEYCSIDASIIS
jgi:hypothetical protein